MEEISMALFTSKRVRLEAPNLFGKDTPRKTRLKGKTKENIKSGKLRGTGSVYSFQPGPDFDFQTYDFLRSKLAKRTPTT